MKRLIVGAALLLLGCEDVEPHPGSLSPYVVPPNDMIAIRRLTDRDYGRWRLIELKYRGRLHVFLQHYDSNNQAMVKVGEFAIETKER